MRKTHIHMTLLCSMLLAMGCQDNDPGDDDDAVADDDDTTLDDDDTTPADDDDSAETGDPCDEEWPDLEVDVIEGCEGDLPTQYVWDLQISHNPTGSMACDSIRAGRSVDTNNDGQVNTADSMQIWIDAMEGLKLYSYDGTELATPLTGQHIFYGTLGEIDGSSDGVELAAAYSVSSDAYSELLSPAGSLWNQQLADNSDTRISLTDLEGDGQLELLVGAQILDASSGAVLATLEDMPLGMTSPSYAADLDLDGYREIIAARAGPNQETEVALFDHQGYRLNTCRLAASAMADWNYFTFAIGDLDGDAGGEFITGGFGWLVACDSDGTLIAEVDVGTGQVAQIGLAQLDGDPLPEVIVADGNQLQVLDTDLTPLWSTTACGSWHPFAVADLDGDGLHEILINCGWELVVLDQAGALLASVAAPQPACSCWICAPAVVDVDNDGLAEIITQGWPLFTVIENPNGGWYVEGSDAPWTGTEKHPGDRDIYGNLPSPTDVHWADPYTNVWQGLPIGSGGSLPMSNLTVESIDVCIDEAQAEATVTAYIGNRGARETQLDLVIYLEALNDGAYLDDAVMPPTLAPGVARAVQFVVPSADVASGIRVVADAMDAFEECDEDNNSGEWTP